MSLHVRSEPHQQLMYSNNVLLVAQQMQNRLRGMCQIHPASGEAMNAADLVGSVEASESSPNDRKNHENAPQLSRRWLQFPNRTHSGQYIDKAEKLQKAMDPTSKYVRGHTLAVERAIGDKILGVRFVSKGQFEVREGGILGTAVDGKTPGGNAVALPAKCYTAAGGLGMTMAKLKAAKLRLNTDDFGLEDDDEMFCAISPYQVNDLLSLAEGDGNTLNLLEQQALRDGKPTTLLGFTWYVTNRLPKDGNGDRICPMWSAANIIGGAWQEVEGRMWNDTSANETPYAVVDAFMDFVRVEDDGVHVISCAEPA